MIPVTRTKHVVSLGVNTLTNSFQEASFEGFTVNDKEGFNSIVVEWTINSYEIINTGGTPLKGALKSSTASFTPIAQFLQKAVNGTLVDVTGTPRCEDGDNGTVRDLVSKETIGTIDYNTMMVTLYDQDLEDGEEPVPFLVKGEYNFLYDQMFPLIEPVLTNAILLSKNLGKI
jgi:hypothetical protein